MNWYFWKYKCKFHFISNIFYSLFCSLSQNKPDRQDVPFVVLGHILLVQVEGAGMLTEFCAFPTWWSLKPTLIASCSCSILCRKKRYRKQPEPLAVTFVLNKHKYTHRVQELCQETHADRYLTFESSIHLDTTC